jgi:hypothetical protein
MRRSKQQRHFRSFVTPPEAALGLLPLDPRPKQSHIAAQHQERLVMIGQDDDRNGELRKRRRA